VAIIEPTGDAVDVWIAQSKEILAGTVLANPETLRRGPFGRRRDRNEDLMRLGLHFMTFKHSDVITDLRETIASTARVADDAGMSMFTVMDHYFQMEHVGGPTEPMLEGYTTLGFVAGQTRQIRLGTLVTGVTYRPPGMLAKIVSTLDVLSAGRAFLGIGAAWYEREHAGLGVPFPSVTDRFEMLEETLKIVEQMWGDDNGRFDGRHYTLAETIDVPGPQQRPRPRILIGGGGERKTLRLVAQYADACNLFASGVDAVKAKLDVLSRHCDEVGRDYDTIEKTILAGPDLVSDPEKFVTEMEGYAAIGIEHVQLATLTPNPVEFAERLGGTILGRLGELGDGV
jgi:F420-dependent oxidoreductase-like protein